MSKKLLSLMIAFAVLFTTVFAGTGAAFAADSSGSFVPFNYNTVDWTDDEEIATLVEEKAVVVTDSYPVKVTKKGHYFSEFSVVGTSSGYATVKVVNSSSSIVKDYFSYADGSYREPNKDIRLITHNFDFLEKDVYFEYNEKGYQIIGKNDTSVKDVAYVSVSERLLREVEPRSSEQIPVDEDINFFLQNS